LPAFSLQRSAFRAFTSSQISSVVAGQCAATFQVTAVVLRDAFINSTLPALLNSVVDVRPRRPPNDRYRARPVKQFYSSGKL
jgi:hypothetical protein